MFKIPFFMKAKPERGEQWLELLERNGYSEAAAASAAPKIEKMDPTLRQELLRWDRYGILPDREIEGFTVEGLTKNAGMHTIGAFLVLDWLLREPEEAKLALAQPVTRLEVSQEALEKTIESEAADKPDAAEEQE